MKQLATAHTLLSQILAMGPGTRVNKSGVVRGDMTPVPPLRSEQRSTPRGFEPLRAEPNGFLVHHLSHSVTVSLHAKIMDPATRSLLPTWASENKLRDPDSLNETLGLGQAMLAWSIAGFPAPAWNPTRVWQNTGLLLHAGQNVECRLPRAALQPGIAKAVQEVS